MHTFFALYTIYYTFLHKIRFESYKYFSAKMFFYGSEPIYAKQRLSTNVYIFYLHFISFTLNSNQSD